MPVSDYSDFMLIVCYLTIVVYFPAHADRKNAGSSYGILRLRLSSLWTLLTYFALELL